MPDEDEDELRARLTRLSGPARARPLVELTQRLADRYQRIGPGKTAALPVLDEAITAADEAYGYFRPGDAMRPTVAATRGWLHGIRHVAHLGSDADRTVGIQQLEEALLAPELPPMMFAMSQITLGQLYLSGINQLLRSVDLAARVVSGTLPPDAAADVDRAAACFETVAGSATVPAEARGAARTLLRMCDALRVIVTPAGTGDTVAALNRVMDGMSVLREIHDEQSGLLASGGAVSFYNADKIADQPLIDRPAAYLEFDDESAAERPATTPVPAPPRDPGGGATAARRELRALVAAGGDLFESLEALLAPGSPPPRPGLVDDLVALATEVTDAGGGTPTDNLLLAAALCLRARAGGRGTRRDLDEAVEALLRAAASTRPPTPEATRVMRHVASAADAARPDGRAEERLSYVLDRRARNGR